MGLETADTIAQLDETWPTGIDPINKGDDHIRLVKSVLKDQFPGEAGDGYATPILATEEDLNNCTDTLGNLQEQITALADAIPGAIPIGSVIMFNAAFSTIPANYQICDGTGGTPNMVDKFVYGTATENELGDIGGNADAIVVSHSHTSNNNGNHAHGFTAQQNIGGFTDDGGSPDQRSAAATTNTANAGTHSHTINAAGSSGTNANLPPYLKLAYIQRMS